MVIPAFNAGRYLSETLESIGRQTHAVDEVLVVEDASPEPCEEVVREFQRRKDFPRLVYLVQPRNMGQAAARNAGMDASNGEILAFLDSDDVWHPEHIERSLINLRETRASVSFAPAAMFRDGEMDRPIHVIRPMFAGEAEIDPFALLSRCFIITSSVVVEAETMKRHGRFDESPEMRAVEDLDSFMRLLRAGKDFSCLKEPTLFYRKHPGSATERMGYIARQSCQVIERHLEWVPATGPRKAKLRARTYWRAAFQLRAAGQADHGSYLAKAIWLSIPHPLFMLKRGWRYGRNLMRLNPTAVD